MRNLGKCRFSCTFFFIKYMAKKAKYFINKLLVCVFFFFCYTMRYFKPVVSIKDVFYLSHIILKLIFI